MTRPESDLPPFDPLAGLARDDKWFVAGGRSSVYAPPAPLWDRCLGFWDEVHLGHTALPRLFTVSLVDGAGRPIPLQCAERHWRPDRLRQTYRGPDLTVIEQKLNLPEDAFVSHLTLRNGRAEARTLHALLWSWQPRGPVAPSLDAVAAEAGRLRYRLRLPHEPGWSRQEALDLHVLLAGDRPAHSWTVQLTEGHPPHPDWRFSVAPEKFHDGRLPNRIRFDVGRRESRRGPEPIAGNVHLMLHFPLTLPPGGETTLVVCVALGFTPERAEAGRAAIAPDAPVRSEELWRRAFARFPEFRCDDPYLQRYYWYRCWQLRAHEVDMGFGGFQHPCVLEGIGPFRNHISYSAHCHMREYVWGDARFAWGSLLNLVANQLPNGAFPGHVNERGSRGAAGSITGAVSFYHARWSNLALLAVACPDRERLTIAYEGLVRYVEHFQRERDPEGSGLYDVINQGETGQEYMARYQAVHPHADDWGPIRLKGVDASCYLYELYRALGKIARELGRADEVARWDDAADRTATAIRTLMWDPDAEYFFDVDPATMRRTGVKALVGIYPFLSDLARPEHLGALRRHLLHPAEFWTPFPFPAESLDSPCFSAEAEWKGKRTNCPWNGRVWPMTNSHACEALAEAALRLDPTLRPVAAEALRRCVRLFFPAGDLHHPNTYEHYHPFTGQPSAYRAIDDYQHSWVLDLILRYVGGIRLDDPAGVAIDPLPMGVSFAVRGVRVRGHRIDVRYRHGGEFVVTVDGQERHRGPRLERVIVLPN